jgi:DNA-binding MarR family transcriptional regulator
MQQKKAAAWNPEAASAFWINRASRLIMRRHETRLRPLGFGMGHLPVLFALDEATALSQKELAARARVEQPTMAEMLARMERDGIVAREPNPEDRRGSLWSLTRSARARLPEAKVALLRGEEEANAHLTKKEKAQLIELLKTVVAGLEADGEG